MSHETHHHSSDNRPGSSSTAAFWFVLILAGLFIAAVNFINAMGNGEGHGATVPPREETGSKTLKDETGFGAPASDTTQHFGTNAGVDTAHMEGH